MSKANDGDIVVIVPAFNEEANIEAVVCALRGTPYDFVVVNDGSVDGTLDVLRRLGAPHVNLPMNLGIGGAVQTGYKYALAHGYRVAVQFDGDGQHDAACIERIVAPVLDGEADLAVGSRFVEGEGPVNSFKTTAARRMGIRMLSLALKAASGARVLDVTSGFRAAGTRAIELFAHAYPVDYPEPESLASALSCGLKVAEVPVTMHERTGGMSSIGGLSSVYYMVKVSLAILLAGSRGR